ncbi:MAG: InlB B-repeat-containing protein, partial [Oscillospiraceae bacterium]|nr:InlB B-repeat-containing protein [Oscillospiraceae bacterium]
MKKFLSCLLVVVLLMGILPPVTFAATVGVTSYSDLAAAIAAAPTDGTVTTIELENSFSATGGALTITAGQNIVLTSAAGSNFTFTQAATGQRHFSVAGNLTLQNVTLSGPGGGTTAIVGGVDVSGGTLTVGVGGTITNCRAPGSSSASYGGGVNVSHGGSLIVSGGTISNNATSWVGGGVLLTGNSTLTMTSGTISGNTSVTNGGGVSIQNGTATISGGTISGNMVTSASSLGGGMSLTAANLTMSGGVITNNRANNGGGIYVDNSGAINMTGGTISNNVAAANGGGIYTAQYTSNNPLPPNSYINLIIGSAVVFSGNVAGNGARIPPSNVGNTNISTTNTSSVFGNPLNNLDINYFGSAGVMVMYLTVTFSPGTNGTFPSGTVTQQNILTTNSPLVPVAPIPIPQPTANYGFIGWSSDGGVTVLTSAQVLTTPVSNNTTYVAQYVPPITVTFDAQGGAPATQTVTPVQVTGTYANALSQVTTPTLEGYVFRGWFTTMDRGAIAGGVQIFPTSIVTQTTDQTLYAWWIADPTVTITFDANGGTPATQVVSNRVVGNSYAATLAAVTTPTWSGYVFQGWFTAPVSGTQITNTSLITDADTTVYAHWLANPTITVTFDAQGGTPDGQQETLQTGSLYGSILSQVQQPTQMGHAFIGWFTTPNGDASGVQIIPTTVVTATTNQTLYAHWMAVSVTITFDAQGGVPATQVVSGQVPLSSYSPVLAAATTPVLAGYVFQGWYDQPQGMGGSHITSGSLIPPMDMTLYAWWEPAPTITITFDAQGGTPDGQTATAATGVTYGIAFAEITEPSLTGYVFSGWFTAPSGVAGSVQILDTTVIAVTANQTLYAHWIVNPTVTITFDAAGGTPAIQTVDGNASGSSYAPVLAAITTPTWLGYSFNGWFDAETGDNQIISSSTIPSADTTLYAQWTPIPAITVTFDSQGGIFNPGDAVPGSGVTFSPDDTLAYYAPVTVGGTFLQAMSATPDPHPPTDGNTYAFGGWWTTPNGDTSGEQVLPSSTVWDEPGDITLYVHWSLVPTVTLWFDGNGGTPAMQTRRGAVVGMEILASEFIQDPTQASYTFIGWFTDAIGGTQIADSDLIPDTNMTYYAQWTPIPPITITFDAQGGTPDGQQQTVVPGDTYGAALSQIQRPTQMGYAFSGWWTTPNGDTSGVQILTTTVVTAMTNQTLYAHWDAVTVTITFDAEGGTPAIQVVPGQ